MTRSLVVRLDSDGDVLLAGPAVRAVAAGSEHTTLLVSPDGEQAARLLPGVDEVWVWRCPWTGFSPPPVSAEDVDRLVRQVAAADVSTAVVLTSFHQSPLPTALLLRLGGVPRIVASSTDYPGSLLDVRHPPGGPHEVQRGLSLAEAAGFRLPEGDDGALLVVGPLDPGSLLDGVHGRYVVLHPHASVPARQPADAVTAAFAAALTASGRTVLLTGGPADEAVGAHVAAAVPGVVDLTGRTSFAELAAVLAGADCVVAPNTGPAHLAAAVGTPVVSLFAPVVPALAWAPWGVPHVVLGDQGAGCAGSRARVCPLPEHTCLDEVDPHDVVRAVGQADGGGRVKVLLWHVHGSWTTSFVQGRHDYLLPVLPGRGPDGRGRARTWDWPATAVEVTPEQLRRGAEPHRPDVVLLQRPQDADLLLDWTGLRAGRDVAAVHVEHNTPRGDVDAWRHPLADQDRVPVVHVTAFNAAMWDNGRARVHVVEHAVPDPGPLWHGTLPRLAMSVNEPVRRCRVAGVDLAERVAGRVPVDVYGMGVQRLGGRGTPFPRLAAGRNEDLSQHELHARMASHRAYLHTYRWTSLGLSLVEAMTLGSPVLVLAATAAGESVPGEAGVVTSDLDRLRETAARLVADPAEAEAAGRAAREHALRRFGLRRFLHEWDRLLEGAAA